jgi:hypothetical protein
MLALDDLTMLKLLGVRCLQMDVFRYNSQFNAKGYLKSEQEQLHHC